MSSHHNTFRVRLEPVVAARNGWRFGIWLAPDLMMHCARQADYYPSPSPVQQHKSTKISREAPTVAFV
jgi:hypothetical protein